MKRILLSICAIFLPWLVLFIKDDPVGALIALILQATIIGWIPASIWALRAIHKHAKRDAEANANANANIKKT